MDTRLQILLRRYAGSNAPEDAVNFVNNYLRSMAGDALTEIAVWSVQAQLDPDGSDSVDLFFSEIDACRKACQYLMVALEDEEIVYGGNLPEWIQQFSGLVTAGYVVDAFSLYENNEPFGQLPFIDVVKEVIN